MLVSFAGILAQGEKTIVHELSKFYQVVDCIRITGRNDFLIKIIVSSMDEFKIINDEVAKLGQVDTSMVVSTFTNNTSIDIEKFLLTNKALF